MTQPQGDSMFKLTLALVLTSATLFGFTQDKDPLIYEEEILRLTGADLSKADPCLINIGYGAASVITEHYEDALIYLTAAKQMIRDSEERFAVGDFMISFIEASAYDNLGMREQTLQSLGTLLLASVECVDEEEAENEKEEENPSDSEDRMFATMMNRVAKHARSPDIRRVLVEISEELIED